MRSTPSERCKLTELADDLVRVGCVRFGDFRLKSGARSPIYFDLRLLTGEPELLERVAAAFLPLLETLDFDRLAAVPYAGLPIGTAIALQSGHPLVYPRKEIKEYGTGAGVEGGFEAGEAVVLIDDVTSSGDSKFEAIDRLKQAGLEVQDVVVLIDREAGAREQLGAAGYRLHSVFGLSELLERWEASGAVEADQLKLVREFLRAQA